MANNFTHNQFRNPTNQGIYYSDHFHNLDTSISFSHSHNNINNNNNNYPGYSIHSNTGHGPCCASNDPRRNLKVLIKENNSYPDNNKPIIRTQPSNTSEAGGNDAFISASYITQPITRDASEKYTSSPFTNNSTPKIP